MKYAVCFQTANKIDIKVTVNAESEILALKMANNQLEKDKIRAGWCYTEEVEPERRTISFLFDRDDLILDQANFEKLLEFVDCNPNLDMDIVALIKEQFAEQKAASLELPPEPTIEEWKNQTAIKGKIIGIADQVFGIASVANPEIEDVYESWDGQIVVKATFYGSPKPKPEETELYTLWQQLHPTK